MVRRIAGVLICCVVTLESDTPVPRYAGVRRFAGTLSVLLNRWKLIRRYAIIAGVLISCAVTLESDTPVRRYAGVRRFAGTPICSVESLEVDSPVRHIAGVLISFFVTLESDTPVRHIAGVLIYCAVTEESEMPVRRFSGACRFAGMRLCCVDTLKVVTSPVRRFAGIAWNFKVDCVDCSVFGRTGGRFRVCRPVPGFLCCCCMDRRCRPSLR